MSHKRHHCKDCKKALIIALQNIDPNTSEQFSNPLPADPKKYPSSISKIHEHLLNLAKKEGRGPKGKWLAKKRMPYDYYLPKMKVFVELDEQQHFTKARLEAIKLYPKACPLGFEKERWIFLCQKLNRKDMDPPHRNEQRAWLDTMRDLGPLFMPKYFENIDLPRTTIRIYEEDKVFCESSIIDSAKFVKKVIRSYTQ